jgi:hypothetical protein
MIDPAAITKFDRTDAELQELALFAVAVAGKNAGQTARKVHEFLELAKPDRTDPSAVDSNPFYRIDMLGDRLVPVMQMVRIGQYKRIGRAWRELARSVINLRTCTVFDLEKVPGIGPKTARFIILHSHKDVGCAVLDTHLLAHLRDLGYHAPKSTPQNPLKYYELEQIVLELAKAAGQTPAEYDLNVWLSRRKIHKK